jgi:hypothetical protein
MMQPQFNQASVEKQLIQWAAQNERKFILALSYLGEEFVNRARLINTYLDQTGNLRSSIGYVIAKDGKILRRNYDQVGDANEGVTKGMNLADEAAAEHPNGIVLIVTAGMQYALYVEAMGYDVLSGSVPNRSQVLNSFMQMMPKTA